MPKTEARDEFGDAPIRDEGSACNTTSPCFACSSGGGARETIRSRYVGVRAPLLTTPVDAALGLIVPTTVKHPWLARARVIRKSISFL